MSKVVYINIFFKNFPFHVFKFNSGTSGIIIFEPSIAELLYSGKRGM